MSWGIASPNSCSPGCRRHDHPHRSRPRADERQAAVVYPRQGTGTSRPAIAGTFQAIHGRHALEPCPAGRCTRLSLRPRWQSWPFRRGLRSSRRSVSERTAAASRCTNCGRCTTARISCTTHMHALNEVSGPVLKIHDDPRLHALGSLLRRTSIDELPNLVNVLRGEMSLVGPRARRCLPRSSITTRSRMRRLRVKPGITCTWQISGRIERFVRRMDATSTTLTSTRGAPSATLPSLLRTIPAVISGDGAH